MKTLMSNRNKPEHRRPISPLRVLAVALFGVIAMVGLSIVPSQATVVAPTSVTSLASATAPADVSDHKFWSASRDLSPVGVCVDGSAINGPSYRVAYIAQQWNLAVNSPNFALNYEDDCVAAGYPPSRRFVVGVYSNSVDTNCTYITNAQADAYNGMLRWTNGPGFYMNNAGTCLTSQTRRDHAVSKTIGFAMGLAIVQGDGWASRVMCSCSADTVPLPDARSAQTMREIYAGWYGG